jgi:hypothetical protein
VGVVEAIAKKISVSPGGAAIFIDYGENFSQSDTLRGFKKHSQRHFLSEPGTLNEVCAFTVIMSKSYNL